MQAVLRRLRQTWGFELFSVFSTAQWNNCAHWTHTLSPSQLWLTKTSFSQTGGTSGFNPAPLLQNTENICRGSSYSLYVLLNAPQQVSTSPARLCTVHILQALIIAGDVRGIFFIWLSNHQNSIFNVFLLVKTGSGLTRALTSVRVLSLCWKANQAFFSSLCK